MHHPMSLNHHEGGTGGAEFVAERAINWSSRIKNTHDFVLRLIFHRAPNTAVALKHHCCV
jgi:hypothetical protein